VLRLFSLYATLFFVFCPRFPSPSSEEALDFAQGDIEKDKVKGHFRIGLLFILMALAVSCARLFPERVPSVKAPSGIRQVSFEIIARDYACHPSVIAVDREGRSVLITLTFKSQGKRHVILIPAGGVRKHLEPGEKLTVEFVADRSGIYKFGCTRFPFLTPFSKKGKLAIK